MALVSRPDRDVGSGAYGGPVAGGRVRACTCCDDRAPQCYSAAAIHWERQPLQEMAEEARDSARLDQLLQATKAGDRAAFAELYRLTARRLLPVALRIMRQRDLAEDVLQEVYLTIWRKAESYKPGSRSPLAWMAAITRNRAIDRRRRDQKHTESHRDWDEGGQQEVDRQHERLQLPDHLSHSVRQCVEDLKENYRKAVLFAYYHGLTHEELAIQLGCPLGTAKSWVRRGLSQLKGCMEQ